MVGAISWPLSGVKALDLTSVPFGACGSYAFHQTTTRPCNRTRVSSPQPLREEGIRKRLDQGRHVTVERETLPLVSVAALPFLSITSTVVVLILSGIQESRVRGDDTVQGEFDELHMSSTTEIGPHGTQLSLRRESNSKLLRITTSTSRMNISLVGFPGLSHPLCCSCSFRLQAKTESCSAHWNRFLAVPATVIVEALVNVPKFVFPRQNPAADSPERHEM